MVTAAITASLRHRGIDAVALKPVITGLDDAADPVWLRDHELLARISGCEPADVNAVGYGPPVSPHFAAELASRPVDPAIVREFVLDAAARHEAVIVEGVGGLLVPLADDCDVRALAVALGLPLVIAARPSLGTINHTLLTLEAARGRRLRVAGVVLTPWPAEPEPIHHSNRATIARLGGVEVSVLAPIARPSPEELRAAGAALPLDGWLGAIGGEAV